MNLLDALLTIRDYATGHQAIRSDAAALKVLNRKIAALSRKADAERIAAEARRQGAEFRKMKGPHD